MPWRGRPVGRRRGSRRGRCPPASGSRARRHRRTRRPRRPRTGRGAARPSAVQHPAVQVGLQAAEGLAGQDVQPDGDQRAGLGVEEPVRCRGPDQLVAAVAAGVADRGDLHVLAERVVHLPVAGRRSRAGCRRGRAAGSPVSSFMPATSSSSVSATTKSSPLLLERLDRRRARPGRTRPSSLADALAGQVRVLLRAGERELLLDDLLGEHEPGVVVPGRAQVRRACRGCRSPGRAGTGSRLPGRVEPQRRRAGQDPDAVPGPDRVPVAGCPRCSATSGRG